MLAVGVVDIHDGKLQLACALAGAEPVDTCCGLFAAADQPVGKRLAVTVQQFGKVATVVNDEVRMAGERFAQVPVILLRVRAVVGVDREALRCQRRCNVVLRGEGIAAGDVNLGAACVQDLAQIRGLGFKVDRHGDSHAAERLRPRKLLPDGVQNRHVGPDPVDLIPPGRCCFGR